MGSLTFIGLGLNDEKSMTVEGLEEARIADTVYAEFYTNFMPNLQVNRLETLVGKKIKVLNRTQLEDEQGKELAESARQGNTVLLVPGDPMIATTHVSLRLELNKVGVRSRIIHAPSIMSAICGATGLQSYKFGKAVTIPFDEPLPNSVQDTISENSTRGLHTLLLLDVKAVEKKQLTIKEALARLTKPKPAVENLLIVGAARLGALDEKVKAGKTRTLVKEDFGSPPHSLVVVGRMHFMEKEALKVLCAASDKDLREIS